ncbi:hypothetical protein O3P69_005592 [Scylla paramamosain]|uniref:Guanine nucleotide-binding protein subunit gamma n=1 Tax=Scylla paramamosain TaxID=85552 RepID=A0AAW0U8A3_SCYPA
MQCHVTQLRQEASIRRVPVSQACYDLMKYCEEHQKGDVLRTRPVCCCDAGHDKGGPPTPDTPTSPYTTSL